MKIEPLDKTLAAKLRALGHNFNLNGTTLTIAMNPISKLNDAKKVKKIIASFYPKAVSLHTNDQLNGFTVISDLS